MKWYIILPVPYKVLKRIGKKEEDSRARDKGSS
jgi:hypothetical protein